MKNNFTFIKEDRLLNKELIKSLLEKFDYVYRENEYKYIRGYIYELVINDILKEPLFLSLLNQLKKKFELITGFNDLSFEKLWLMSSKSSDPNTADLPYIPHIDKRRYLKAMVYLHDVSVEHGPTHLGRVKSTIDIEQKRKEIPENYKEKGSNTIDDESLEENLTPMTGKAGDVVFFDTNTPHKAGIINEGYYRKVLRFDFERPFFNPKQTIFNYIINKFK